MPDSSFVVVVPARYASMRLPAKPLALIDGRAMILRVVDRVMRSDASEVVVATDDERIADVVRGAGMDVAMTRADHPSGSDRVMEVARQRGWSEDSRVVNVQGDEPLIPPAVINQVAQLLDAADVSTLSAPLLPADLANPDAVKVVTSDAGDALYFSRAPIPWNRDDGAGDGAAGRRHIGIYGYRVRALDAFVAQRPSTLEQIEKLEQLRLLSAGVRIRVGQAVEPVPAGVDSPDDLTRVEAVVRAAR